MRNTKYVGDGDTKSYLDVVINDHYQDVVIEKLERIGHIQKRVGARLTKMRKDGCFANVYEDEGENSKKKKKK